MTALERIPIKIVEALRTAFRAKTYQVEGGIVLLALLVVTELSDKGWVEYLGVAAVFFTFMHATIAEYMREAEAKREAETTEVITACHAKLPYYFYTKEVCWFAYFFLIGANSALVGVFIFLLYQPWRRLWRKYHPI